jgi:hypothetical protein
MRKRWAGRKPNHMIKAHIQGPQNRTHGAQEYMKWQNIIFDTTGVSCTILVKPECISIRTRDYTDFILARSAIKGRTKLPIIRDT